MTDGNGTDRAELRIEVTGVNDAPIASADADAVIENSSINRLADASILLDDTDAEGNALTIASFRTGGLTATNGAIGSVGGALAGAYGTLTLNADGSYSYAATAAAVDALAAGETADDVFTYTVTDGAATDQAELRITVTGANDAPKATVSIDEVPENGSINRLADGGVLFNDTDVDGDLLSVIAIRPGALSDARCDRWQCRRRGGWQLRDVKSQRRWHLQLYNHCSCGGWFGRRGNGYRYIYLHGD